MESELEGLGLGFWTSRIDSQEEVRSREWRSGARDRRPEVGHKVSGFGSLSFFHGEIS